MSKKNRERKKAERRAKRERRLTTEAANSAAKKSVNDALRIVLAVEHANELRLWVET